MTLEAHAKVAEQIANAINSKDLDAFKMLHLENVTSWNPMTPEPHAGLGVHVEDMQDLWRAFPDMAMEMKRIFGEGEWLCTEYVVTGTHTGPMKGPDGREIPPTGKPLRLPVLGILRIVNGKIAEEKDYFDTGSLAAQLGLSP